MQIDIQINDRYSMITLGIKKIKAMLFFIGEN